MPGGESVIQTDKENSHQSAYLDEFINKITIERIKSRNNYVNEFQNGIRMIFTLMYGTLFPNEPVEKIKEAMDIFINKLTNIDILVEIALSALHIGGRNLEEMINDILTESLNEAGLNNFSPIELKQFVGAIYDNVPQDFGEEGIVTMFNENKEKLVYLPNTQEYKITLTATADGSMSYGISEYSTSAGTYTKNINYINLDVKAGEVYQASIPACDEINPVRATDLNYTLIGPDSSIIEPTLVLNDEDVNSAYHMVTVVSEDTAKGLAIGSEIYQYGSFALVEATPLAGYQFAGWYEGNNLISREASYRFLPDRDITLTACFDTTGGSNTHRNNDSADDYTDKGIWIQDANGWWYHYGNGTWPSNQWCHLLNNGVWEWFYFNPDGYMATGWVEVDGHKYYLNPVSDGTQGRMMTGWTNIDDKWYYFKELSDGTKGSLITNSWVDGYWVDENGIWNGLPKNSLLD